MMKITHAAFFHPDASLREKRSPITWNSRMKKITMKKITISDHRKVRNVVARSMRLLYWSCGLGGTGEPGGHDPGIIMEVRVNRKRRLTEFRFASPGLPRNRPAS